MEHELQLAEEMEMVNNTNRKFNPDSLKELCRQTINVNIRLAHRLWLLVERRVLPKCLAEECAMQYAFHVDDVLYGLPDRIKASPSYKMWHDAVLANVIFSDTLELRICKYVIDELYDRRWCDETFHIWPMIREVCIKCYELYYSEDNEHPNVKIEFVEHTTFVPVYHFERYRMKYYWCNECLQPLFELPKKCFEQGHDAIVQVIKRLREERIFEACNTSFSSFWHPSLPSSPSSMIDLPRRSSGDSFVSNSAFDYSDNNSAFDYSD